MKVPWERKLRMVWVIKKDGLKSFLVGTAHFFPCSFRKSLAQLIQKVETVLFEGPLDESNMDAVRKYGLEGQQSLSLYKTLNQIAIKKINTEIMNRTDTPQASFSSYLDLFQSGKKDLLFSEIENLRPWMAFFSLWSRYLVRRGWKYSVDLEALSVAKELGKKVVFLETIEEQLEALDGIPFERIVNYLNNFDKWGRFSRNHKKQYLRGSLDGLLAITGEFPTRCPSIIENRDPVFFHRMRPHIDAGGAAVFLGTTHIRGVATMLEKDGFTLTQIQQ
jgi:hypothetical protein